MSRFKTLALVAIPAAAAALAVPQAVVAQASSPLNQVSAHLKAVNSLVASFSQTDRRGQTMTGTFSMKKPGRLRFQYQPGVPMLIVADGRKLNMIDYETRRVDSWPIGNSPLGVLLNPDQNLSKVATVVQNDAQVLMVRARDPRHREYGTINLAFAKIPSAPAGLMLRGWTVVDAQNNRTTVRLSNPRINVAVPDSTFTFQKPAPKGRAKR
jgi:outer membrane lipoprotein-sorting protein